MLCHSERALGARAFFSARVARRNRLPRLSAFAWLLAQHRRDLRFRNSLPGLIQPLGAQPGSPHARFSRAWGGHIDPVRITPRINRQTLLPPPTFDPLLPLNGHARVGKCFKRRLGGRSLNSSAKTGFGRSRFLTPTGALKRTRARLTGFRNDTLKVYGLCWGPPIPYASISNKNASPVDQRGSVPP